MRSVKHSRKLATATASLFWRECSEFCGEKTFHNLECLRVCTVLLQFSFDPSLWWSLLLFMVAITSLYGGHCFSVWLPSKITRGFTHRIRLPASRNNVPQHIKMFPDSIIAERWIDEAGFGASSSGVYWRPKRGVTHSICELNIRVV